MTLDELEIRALRDEAEAKLMIETGDVRE